ncbi:MAG: FAD-dependent oxidoreductase [Alphaproteobacteria bacterium]|nr:FAD-dependent oxidoreductase [Alphaproteobacteria bacterium]
MTDDPTAYPGESLLILGAGAVGSASALTFARRGFKVTVIDRGTPGSGASYGNAGGVVPSASPLAQPGLPWQVPGMLFDPTGPLSIKPTELIKSLPWFLRFVLECSTNRAEANSKALYALAGAAAPAWKDLVQGTAGAALLRDVGWLKVYSSEAGFQNHASERAFLERRDAQMEILSQDELRQLEPNLAPIFVRGMLQPDGLFALNPQRLVESVAAEATAQGATFLQETIEDLTVAEDGRITVRTNIADHKPDRVMICAGAFSKRFARALGAAPLLVAERGYHAMFDRPEKCTTRPAFWVENSMVLCPMEQGMRLTTQSEFAGLTAEPNYARLNRMIPKAKEMMPQLDLTVRDRWMGHRPSTPDSLPVLGVAPNTSRGFFNFGHNHLGLTLSAISARVAADLWTGSGVSDGIPVEAYRPLR